ncbi:MAG: uncharacterized protein KVP18_002800 [Porospora cf. gigantea A]|uniref:uncharacterized protein n=2 Tax=Porospora cf. gigantea A TaxID=2853593 RepID=UPI003559B690|nr:MAG: hypothetical protein KVP18_002800 [Porospora cf. gigantea A]
MPEATQNGDPQRRIEASHNRVRRKSLHRAMEDKDSDYERALFGVDVDELIDTNGFFRRDYRYQIKIEIDSVQILDQGLLSPGSLRIGVGDAKMRTEVVEDLSTFGVATLTPYSLNRYLSVHLYLAEQSAPVALGVLDVSLGELNPTCWGWKGEMELEDRVLRDTVVSLQLSYAISVGALDSADVVLQTSEALAPHAARPTIPACSQRSGARLMDARPWCKLVIAPARKHGCTVCPVVEVGETTHRGVPFNSSDGGDIILNSGGSTSALLKMQGSDYTTLASLPINFSDFFMSKRAVELDLIDPSRKIRGRVVVSLELHTDVARARRMSQPDNKPRKSRDRIEHFKAHLRH